MFVNFFRFIGDLFLIKENNDTYVGLSQLRTMKKTAPQKAKPKKQKPKEVKISDLMRGIN